MKNKNEIFIILANLISLLGGKKDIIELIRGIENLESISDSEIDSLCRYYSELSDSVKDRLVNVSGQHVTTNSN